MANSPQYKELKKRIRELKRHLLPTTFSDTGDYPERVRDRTRGFRVLVHAEIENYLEDLAVNIINEKIHAWNKLAKPSYIIICFIAAYHAGWVTGEDDVSIFSPQNKVKPKEKIMEAINAAHQQYRKIINSNNGIKTANLKSIFLPLGIDFSDIDASWLAAIDSFGTQRGQVAHQAKHAHTQIDPLTESDTVELIMEGMKVFDALLMKISI